jgi:hypothetical protein
MHALLVDLMLTHLLDLAGGPHMGFDSTPRTKKNNPCTIYARAFCGHIWDARRPRVPGLDFVQDGQLNQQSLMPMRRSEPCGTHKSAKSRKERMVEARGIEPRPPAPEEKRAKGLNKSLRHVILQDPLPDRNSATPPMVPPARPIQLNR